MVEHSGFVYVNASSSAACDHGTASVNNVATTSVAAVPANTFIILFTPLEPTADHGVAEHAGFEIAAVLREDQRIATHSASQKPSLGLGSKP